MAGNSENTMALLPHVTAKLSEAKVRDRLSFPATDYVKKRFETPGTNYDDFFSNPENYDTRENELMERLTVELMAVQQSMIDSGILVLNEGKYTLSCR